MKMNNQPIEQNPSSNKKKKRFMLALVIAFCTIGIGGLGILNIFVFNNHDGLNKKYMADITRYETGEYTFSYNGEESNVLPEEVKENISNYIITIYEDMNYISIGNK